MADELTEVAEDSARGGFFLFSGTVLSTIILAVGSILVARFLGPELYGQYTLAFVVPQLLFLFTDLGVNQGIIRFAASLRTKGEGKRVVKIIKYGLLLKTTIGVSIFIVSYAFADFFASVILQRPDLALYVRIASISIIFQVIFATATSAFIGLDKTEYNALAANIQATAKAIISLSLVLIGFGVSGALMGHVASYIVAAGASVPILFFIMREKQRTENSHEFSDDVKILIRYGAPLYISLLLIGFIPLYQNVLLAIFTTDTDVGNFRAASNFLTLITVVVVPISSVLLPAFSKLEASTQKLRTFFKLANKYTTLLVLPITILVIVFSSEIVQIIYGSTYRSAPLFLATNSLVYLLVGVGYLTLTSFYNGLGETRTTLYISLIDFIAVVTLSPILTKTYNVQGLIIAFIIAHILGTFYGSYIARKKFRIEFETRTIARIYFISILSSVLPLAVLFFSPLPKLLNVAAGGLLYLFTYITLTPAAKIVHYSELQTVSEVLQRIKPLTFIATPLIKYQQKILSRHKQPLRSKLGK